MRRFIPVLWILLMLAVPAAMLLANGKDEVPVTTGVLTGKPINVVLVHGYADYYQSVMDLYSSRYKNVTIEWIKKSKEVEGAIGEGALKAHVFMSTPGGVGKFLVPDTPANRERGANLMALELTDEYIENIGDYKDGVLDIYYREGQLLALPVAIAYNAMNLNLTLAEDVGFNVPGRNYLTTDEFLKFAELIKKRGPKGSYGTSIYAGNGGSQGANVNWFAGFGVNLFENGDWTKTTVNTPAAVKAFEFLKTIYDNGYTPPETLVLDDDDSLQFWARGQIGLHWSRAGGMIGMPDGAVEQGFLKERFDSVFMSWPKAPGVDKAPITFGGAAGLVLKSGDYETDRMAAALLDYMTGALAQTMTIKDGGNYASRKSPAYPLNCVADQGCVFSKQVLDVADTNGLYDLGYTTLVHGAIMESWLKVFQGVLKGDITPRKAVDIWEDEINDVLSN